MHTSKSYKILQLPLLPLLPLQTFFLISPLLHLLDSRKFFFDTVWNLCPGSFVLGPFCSGLVSWVLGSGHLVPGSGWGEVWKKFEGAIKTLLNAPADSFGPIVGTQLIYPWLAIPIAVWEFILNYVEHTGLSLILKPCLYWPEAFFIFGN